MYLGPFWTCLGLGYEELHSWVCMWAYLKGLVRGLQNGALQGFRSLEGLGVNLMVRKWGFGGGGVQY